MHCLRIIAFASLAWLSACADPNNGAQQPLEPLVTMRSGGLFDYPLQFGERVSMSFHETDATSFGFCISVDNDTNCGEINRPPTEIYLAKLHPYCQGDDLALGIELFDATEEPFEVFYVSGSVTQDRQEAATLAATISNCTLAQANTDREVSDSTTQGQN